MEKSKKYNFTVLIPVFNDEDKIKNLKLELKKCLANQKYFTCFVDDSYNRDTLTEIKKSFKKNFHIIKRKKSEKYSTRFSASYDGFKWISKNIKTKYVVEIDSDLSHHPKDIMRGINLLKEKKCDLVIGSKYFKGSKVENRKLLRIAISRSMTLVCRFLFGDKITDYTNTYRFYTSDLVNKFVNRKVLFKSPIGHLHNLLFILKKRYFIKEISVEYIEINPESSVKIVSMLRYLIEFIYCIILNKFSKTS